LGAALDGLERVRAIADRYQLYRCSIILCGLEYTKYLRLSWSIARGEGTLNWRRVAKPDRESLSTAPAPRFRLVIEGACAYGKQQRKRKIRPRPPPYPLSSLCQLSLG
jgi:hypothetical protein